MIHPCILKLYPNNNLPFPVSYRHQFRDPLAVVRPRFPPFGGAVGRRGEAGPRGGGAPLLHRGLGRRRPMEEERRVPPVPGLSRQEVSRKICRVDSPFFIAIFRRLRFLQDSSGR